MSDPGRSAAGVARGPMYRFGPLEQRGLIAGWRAGQVITVFAGLACAATVLRTDPSGIGVAVALSLVAAAVAMSSWPIYGRAAQEWAPQAVRFGAGRLLGPRFNGSAKVFAAMEVLTVDLRQGEEVGVIADRRRRTFTCLMPAWSHGFTLGSRADKERQIEAWSSVLSGLAREGSAVHRIQWVETALPRGVGSLSEHFRQHLAGADACGAPWSTAADPSGAPPPTAGLPLAASSAVASYREMLNRFPPMAGHQVVLAVSVSASRSARAVRSAGRGDPGAVRLLMQEVGLIRTRLGEVGIRTANPQGPKAIARYMAAVFACSRQLVGGCESTPSQADPSESDGQQGPTAISDRGHHRSVGGLPSIWPTAVDERWGALRVDGVWSATYWVAEWPRTDVSPDFLSPLLIGDVRRSVAVVMSPTPPLKAARQAEHARTADIADAQLRRSSGFVATARRNRQQDVVIRREAELADGHAHFRFSGYVTVTADDENELERGCQSVEQAAAGVGLLLRRCYGDQLEAFLCTLPIGKGLAS